jgi:tetratricopeptide (TPR) repeat protein
MPQQNVQQKPQPTGRGQQTEVTPARALAEAQELLAAGQLARSEALCRQILTARPEFHAAWFHLGLIAVEAGKLQAAAEAMTRALGIDPSVSAYSRSLCEVHRRLRRYGKAIACGTVAVALAPRDAEARYNFGLALGDAGRDAPAAEQYRAALACDPSHALAANNLGAALERLKDEKGAEEAYAQAVAINPRHAEAQNNLGALQSARGELDAARASFTAAVGSAPYFALAHHNLSTLKSYTAGDPHLAALEELAKKAGSMPVQERIRLWFALGKAREDVKRYDEAFEAYSRGNALKRATFKYDEKALRRVADDLIRRFDRKFVKARRKAGFADETPVFIVGMPRSGTTLIEQVLSSHPGVHGAGEINDLDQSINEVLGLKGEAQLMDRLLQASDADIRRIGEVYVSRIRKLDAKALRITDKMMGNFFYAGVIGLALPGAKIIHAVRNPMDTCFSNYTRLFNESMPFAYDLGELGRYYNLSRDLMAHWKSVLPAGSVLELRYEDMVGDLEGQARRLIKYCGLPWRRTCLKFHENRRPVKTASVAQVRQPIYKDSVMRWKNFKTHLAPLRAAIDGEN